VQVLKFNFLKRLVLQVRDSDMITCYVSRCRRLRYTRRFSQTKTRVTDMCAARSN